MGRMRLSKAETRILEQYWKLGTGSSELEPYNLSVGVLYRLPFGFRR